MNTIRRKTTQWRHAVSRLCKNRFMALALILAVATGTLFGVPIVAAAPDAAETATQEDAASPEAQETLAAADTAKAADTAAPEDAASEEAAEEVPAVMTADRCAVSFFKSNLQAMQTATKFFDAVYTGELPQLYTVTVSADGNTDVVCMENGQTAADAVRAAGVTLGEEDYLNVDGDHFVQDGMTASVTRVTYKEYTKDFSISYSTEIRYTAELRKGASKVSQEGVAGVRTVTYRDRIENGKVISTKEVGEKVTKQPVKKIILKGTKVGKVVSEAPFDIALSGTAQPVSYQKKLTGQATAYTSDRGDSGKYTSCGYRAAVGIVAVDPRVIPYGTKLWIVSEDGSYVYGYAIAGDTGGSVRSGRLLVDLYFDTYGECTQFGRRTMNVYVLS